MLEKHSHNAFKKFSQDVYTQFGMRIAILAGFQDSQGDSQVTLYA